MTTRSTAALALAAALILSGAGPGAAQSPLPPESDPEPVRAGPALSVVGGRAPYEIRYGGADGGTIEGTATVLGGGFDLPLAGWLFLEPRFTRLSLEADDAERYGGGSRQRWQLDFSFRGEFRVGPIRPYLAAGLGGLFHIDEERPADRDFVTASYAVAGGVRVPLTLRPGLEVRAEGRYRTFDDTGSRVVPLLLAVGWRF